MKVRLRCCVRTIMPSQTLSLLAAYNRIAVSNARGGVKEMTRTILFWTIAGSLVAGLWAIYAAAIFPKQLFGPGLWTLINVTCPVAFASFHFHFGIKLYWVVLVNAATYALIGLVVESLRHQLRHAK